MPSESVGLYIGSQSADVVSLSGSFQRPQLVHFGRVQLPKQGSWRSQTRLEEASGQAPDDPSVNASAEITALAGTLKTLLGHLKLSSNARLHIAIASEAVVIRYFQMPFIPSAERKVAVAFEAKKYLPFKLEELTADYQILTHKTEPNLMRVMFFGIKTETLSAFVSVFKTLELAPVSLEPASVSLMRLTRQTGQSGPSQAQAILSIERDTASINIARGNLLYLSRNVTIPQPAAGEGLSQELMEALIQETRVSIDYYRRRFASEAEVSKVLVCTKEMEAEQLAEVTSALGGLPVELALPFKKISQAEEAPPGLAVATGLALRGFEKSQGPPEVNLLPPSARSKSYDLIKISVAQAAAAVLLLFFWHQATHSNLAQLEGKLQALRLRQEPLEGLKASANISELEIARDGKSLELDFLKKVNGLRGEYANLLSSVEKLLPQEGWLTHLAMEDEFKGPAKKGRMFQADRYRLLTLSGAFYANNQRLEMEAVNNFLASLRTEKPFAAAYTEFSLDSVQRGEFRGEEVTEFHLTCSSAQDSAVKKPPAGGP
ncbi:MAG: pilus assembly protein PilM [Candidatus Omnitrophica bacterium]|nr:pilus assembly protein PilM [Candidatus Omnitrophota bacterium]